MDIQEQFNLVAKEYDENRKKFIPCFDDYYSGATDFVASVMGFEPSLIFDLGSGTGLLPSFWYRHFPASEYVLVDIAEEMLAVAKKRFAELPNFRFEISDYSQKLPAGNPELVISALSIHHLEHDAKKSLFKNIYSTLAENGLFVNYDQFCAENSAADKKIEEYWISGIKASGISQTEYDRWLDRKKLDRECSVREEIGWLREAGFKNVECIYLKGKFAVIMAEKV